MYERLEDDFPHDRDGQSYLDDAYFLKDYKDGYGEYAAGGYPSTSALYLADGGYPPGVSLERPPFAASSGSAELLQGSAIPFEPTPAKPLRVMYAGPCFSGGGVEQHALSLARFLDPRRLSLTKYLVTGAERFQQHSVAGRPFQIQACRASEFSQAVKEADILLIWGDGFDSRLPDARPLCIYVAHGESWWVRKCLLSSSRVTDHVIAVSKRVEQRVCNGFPTTTITNGVDAGRLGQTRSSEASRERFGFSPGDFVLGSVGRFAREKRMDLLIQAVALLPRNFKLLLVGHGPRRAELLDMANDCIPGRYAFVKGHDYLGDYYRAMDAFCLASEHEGFGLVIPEAMLCERPVIVTNVGCVPEVLTSQVSGLVVEHSAQAFAGAAKRLHAHPAWARGMAVEGRAFADRHLHASRMAGEYENLLLRLHRLRSAARQETAR